MKVLIWSRYGDGAFIAFRAMLEKHKVWFFPGKGKGALEEIEGIEIIDGGAPELLDRVDEAELIIFDMVGLGKIGDRLLSAGKPVITGGTLGDELELNRLKAMKLFEKLGIGVPYKGFRSYRQAAEFVRRNGGRWVFKPLGNRATSHTYVAQAPDSSDLVRFVERWAEREDGPCVLQEHVEGIEVSTEGFFDGERFVPPFNHTIEKKRFMEGDKGPNTGCMGNLVWTLNGDRDVVVKKVLEPLSALLKGRYCGPIDVNCIINAKGIYGLEFTCRFGYSAFQALLELFSGDPIEQLKLFAVRGLKRFRMREELAGAVRLSLPPWPVCSYGVKELRGVVPLRVEPPGWKHFHPADVRSISPEGDIEMAGIDGVIGEASARGETVREVRRRIYRQIDRWLFSRDVQYRSDIFSGCLEKLQALGSFGVEVPANA